MSLDPATYRAPSWARSPREFDGVVTTPLHGYRDTDDYGTRASAKHVLGRVRVPCGKMPDLHSAARQHP